MNDWFNRCHFGDVRDVLQRMAADGVKVQTIVTSPPYWGLRSYLPADHPDKAREIGSEPTLGEFLQTMVGVFDLCREVLADDGTMFVNMGDSYWGGGRVGGGSFSSERRGWHAVPCGTSGKAPEDSPARDCLCGSLCDACRKAYRTGKSHSSRLLAPTPAASPCESIRGHTGSVPDHPPTSDSLSLADRTSVAIQDQPRGAEIQASEPLSVLASTTPGSSPPLPRSCSPARHQGAGCQLCGGSLPDCDQASARTGECSVCKASRESAAGTEGTGVSGSAYPYSTSASLKPKDLIGQPWRLAFALQDAGWWLRQDIIWSKPNPMPESTRDRCTKAHEYLFLLAKNERYYYDFDAVQEPVNGNANPRRATIKTPDGWDTRKGEGGHGSFHAEGREKGLYQHAAVGRRVAPVQIATKVAEAGQGIKNNDSFDAALEEMRDTRNRRSVWTVASEPYKGAHFATFPTKLIEHCILAGAPVGGTVLDIFMGSGTTAQVAEKLGRKWIGIDIDERNAALQSERLRQPSLALESA